MAQIDQSTRRGRLLLVFIAGMLVFGGLMLAGVYLSHQRKLQFEASQNGSSQVTSLDDTQEGSEEVADDHVEKPAADEDEATTITEKEDNPEAVASTGPSNGGGAEQLPVTGPSNSETNPTELPATGPEALWLILAVGLLVTGYLSFEYRRSRLAFQRAALRRQ